MCLILAFVGVYVMISGKESSDSLSDAKKSINIGSMLILLCSPILIACGSIALRTLRSINEFATGTYISIFGTLIFGSTVALSDKGFLFYQYFSLSDYCVLVLIALFGSLSLIMRAKSAQYEMASRTSILCYLSIIIMFFFDVVLYNAVINVGSVNGVMIIAIANALSAYFVFRKT